MDTQKINTRHIATQKAYLYFSENTFQSHYYEIGDFLSIGRHSTNKLCLDDPHISGQHARIEKHSKGYFFIRDLSSKNGSILNGNHIKEAILNDGDQVQVGQTSFRLLYKKINNDFLKSHCEPWQKQLNRIPLIAKSDCPVLLLGASGTGKDEIARKIHELSTRSEGPFISVNCSALSESLIESELFGHIKGSFTGALNDRQGAFEAAKGGTLFLDEIGDLPISLQPKLLRALENCEIKPVGSDRIRKTNVRILAATHNNLKQNILHKKFREDLYFRLNTLQITTPDLSKRLEDFEMLLYLFARQMKVNFSFQAVQKLRSHQWPGNIRELKNVVTKASVLFKNQPVQACDVYDLVDGFSSVQTKSNEQLEGRKLLKELEYKMICEALVQYRGNQRRASALLEIPTSTLHDKVKRYGINIRELINAS